MTNTITTEYKFQGRVIGTATHTEHPFEDIDDTAALTVGDTVQVTVDQKRFTVNGSKETAAAKVMEIGSLVEVNGETRYQLRRPGGKGKGGARRYSADQLTKII